MFATKLSSSKDKIEYQMLKLTREVERSDNCLENILETKQVNQKKAFLLTKLHVYERFDKPGSL